ncbi:MAG: DUF4406 domain-containing protein [Bacteroidales bacterium]|nr:DUF4406 domain-containing protein [Bacteroidales bacterium]
MNIYLSYPRSRNSRVDNLQKIIKNVEVNGNIVVNEIGFNIEYENPTHVLKQNLQFLSQSDTIFMLKDWQYCPIASSEWVIASEIGINIIYESKLDEDDIISNLLATITEETGFDLNSLRSRKRDRELSDVRNIFVYIVYKLTSKSLSDIGRFISRDHSTIINSIKVSNNMLKTHYNYRKLYRQIFDTLNKRIKKMEVTNVCQKDLQKPII